MVGFTLGGLVVALVLLIVVLVLIGGTKLNKKYDIAVAAVAVPVDDESVVRGRHIVESYGLCTECHGESLEGEVVEDDPAFGTIVATNLTGGRGGVGDTYTNEDYVRAIRHGVAADGKPLVIMPSKWFNRFSDEDLGSVIAYVKSVPAVDNEQSGTSVGILGRVLTVVAGGDLLGATDIDHDAPRPSSPVVGVTSAYGSYLAVICTACHQDDLSGGPIPGGGPEAPGLRNLDAPRWSEVGFIATLRTGVTPYGKELDPENMPWKSLGKMTDDEL